MNPGTGLAGVTPENGVWPLEHKDQLVYEAVSTTNGIPLEEAPEGEVATAMVLTRSVRAEPEGPEEPVASRPGEGPRKPAGRKKGWWQIW